MNTANPRLEGPQNSSERDPRLKKIDVALNRAEHECVRADYRPDANTEPSSSPFDL